jgi:ferric-dicitrate binding protein FerR (iron transport regulator)
MTSIGRMTYGAPPQHPAPHRRRWRTPLLLVLAALLLAASAGWMEQNRHSFESKADVTLCHLLDDRC